MTSEIWKPIDHPIILANKYMISSYGRVLNTDSGKILKGNNPKHNGGYITFCLLGNDGRKHDFLAHRLVIGTFNGYQNTMEVNHIDANKSNNHIDNLEYTTRLGNAHHAVTHGLYQRGEKRYNSILTDDRVHTICKMLEDGHNPTEIIRILDLPRSEISIKVVRDIMNRITWNHISKDYCWSMNKLRYKIYDYEDLVHIIQMIQTTDMNSSEIAKNFPQYKFKSLKNVVKKIRQGKLYKELFDVVMSSSTIQSIPENNNSREVSE